MMTFQQYQDYFDAILKTPNPQPPYDNESYLQYAKLNWSRSQRWLKQNPLTEATKKIVTSIAQKQQWVVITEPWCGDAAHIVPILYLMSQLNDQIGFELQLRDTGSEIEQYLTHGTRSIPMLVVRDEKGADLFHWGPRPAVAKKVYEELKEQQADFETAKIALQQVYNADKSLGIQEEVSRLLLEHNQDL